jgi:beta-galactosidase
MFWLFNEVNTFLLCGQMMTISPPGKFIISFFFTICFITADSEISAQPYVFDDILFGVAYYHEYMPYERLDEDVILMKEAGINYVRLGESTWQLWEPRDGEFDFAWMDRVVAAMHKAGIKVIMGTPTYSVPAWLYHKHPGITAMQSDGQRLKYGIRQNADLTNAVYLYYSQRVIKRIVEHYKENPAVIGYQIDNETHSKWPDDKDNHIKYIEYLKGKFHSVDTINKVWGFNYWGQAINDWNELHPASGFNHPGYRLEWARYQRAAVTDFLLWQASIVRKYKGASQFVMHDFAGALRSDIDQKAISETLDYAGVNIYHYDQDKSDGLRIAMQGDFTRSLKMKNYIVPETNAASIGWNSKEQFPPYDGQLRLNYYAHIGSGANLISYWHWHSLHNGIEQYWRGVLPHDLKPGRIYKEVSTIGHEREKLGKKLVNIKKNNKVAILFSEDSDVALSLQRFDNNFKGPETGPWDADGAYQKILTRFYKTLYDLNVEADFVFDNTEDLSQYQVLIVPSLYIASDGMLSRLSAFVKNGGHLIVTMKSGFCNEHSAVRHATMPAGLTDVGGFTYQEFSTLRSPVPLKGDPFHTKDQNYTEQWVEFLQPTTARPLAFYDHPVYDIYPAIVQNHSGKGMMTYMGTIPSESIMKNIVMTALAERNILGVDYLLPASIKVKHGVSNSGKNLHFYYNFSSTEKTFPYTYRDGVNLLTNVPLRRGKDLTLKAWDVAVIETLIY